MADKPTREEIISSWVQEHKQLLRKKRKKSKFEVPDAGVTINSLMDAMTIILVFLLMNYSVDPLRIDQSDVLKLPFSTTDITPSPSAAVTVNKKGIIVNDKVVVQVKDGSIEKMYKRGGEATSLQIQPLFEALNDEAQRQKSMAQLTGRPFGAVLTIIADQETPYRLLTEVLYTAGQAEFQKFKFAVTKGGQRGVAAAGPS